MVVKAIHSNGFLNWNILNNSLDYVMSSTLVGSSLASKVQTKVEVTGVSYV